MGPPPCPYGFVTDWASTPEGQLIVYQGQHARHRHGRDGHHRRRDAHAARPRPDPAEDVDGRVSADGRWLAYTSDETGRTEVYIQPLGGSSNRWQVSSGGGVSPRWRRDGKELCTCR